MTGRGGSIKQKARNSMRIEKMMVFPRLDESKTNYKGINEYMKCLYQFLLSLIKLLSFCFKMKPNIVNMKDEISRQPKCRTERNGYRIRIGNEFDII